MELLDVVSKIIKGPDRHGRPLKYGNQISISANNGCVVLSYNGYHLNISVTRVGEGDYNVSLKFNSPIKAECKGLLVYAVEVSNGTVAIKEKYIGNSRMPKEMERRTWQEIMTYLRHCLAEPGEKLPKEVDEALRALSSAAARLITSQELYGALNP